MIRDATADDFDELRCMAKRFVASTPYAKFVSDDLDVTAGVLKAPCRIVAELDGKLIGALLGMSMPFWFAPIPAAFVLAWWVEPEHRSGVAAARLLEAFETWARERNCLVTFVTDLHPASDAPDYLHRLGYRPTERHHAKEL